MSVSPCVRHWCKCLLQSQQERHSGSVGYWLKYQVLELTRRQGRMDNHTGLQRGVLSGAFQFLWPWLTGFQHKHSLKLAICWLKCTGKSLKQETQHLWTRMLMQNQIFQGKMLLTILFIKQPSVVGGKFCFNFSYLVVNFMFVALKTCVFLLWKIDTKSGMSIQ